MKYCINCGNEMQDDEVFCGECGAKAEEQKIETVFCPECGTENQGEDGFCQNCGASLTVGESGPNGEKPEEIFCPQCGSSNSSEDGFCQNCGASLKEEIAITPPSDNLQVSQKKSKLPFIIGGVAVAAAAVIAVAVGIGGAGKSSAKTPSVIYYKDKGLYQYQLNKGNSLELTDKALNSRDEDFYTVSSLLYNVIQSEDGRYIFYFEKSDGWSGTLYYKDLKKQSDKNDTSVKVDSDVTGFQITENNKLLYLKNKNSRNLYIYDMNAKNPEKEKLASDVMSYIISKAENDLIWVTMDDVLYHKSLTGDGDKKKLDSDISLQYYTEDLKTIYYTKDSNAYCYKNLSEKEKIASDVWVMGSYHDDTGIYYGKRKEEQITVDDLVEDDMKDIDKGITEPDFDDFKKKVTTTWGSRYETDYDAYEKAMEKYQAKQDRDYIRSQLESYEPYGIPTYYDVYTYDGKESKELVKDVQQLSNIGKYNNPIYIGFSLENQQLPTILLSELESVYDIDEILNDYFEETGDSQRKGYVFADGTVMDIEYDSKSEYYGDSENKTIYSVSYEDTDDYQREYQELYSIKYTDKGLESPVLLDDDMDEDIEFSSYYIENGGFYYVKDFDDDENAGSLFCSGNKIDDDVFTFRTTEDAVYYLKDKSGSNYSGTLMKYDGKKSTSIADDVSVFTIVDDYAAVITDYNTRRKQGDLKLYPLSGKGKEKLLDEEVAFIQYGIGSSELFD